MCCMVSKSVLLHQPGLKRHVRLLGRRAFTLTETLVAAAMVGFLFLALYSAIGTNLSLVQMCREEETATQILTEKFEALRLYNWEQVTNRGFIPVTFIETIEPGMSNRPGFFTGTVSIATAPITENYRSNLLLVTVTLDWVSGGRPHTRRMTSFFARNGLETYNQP